MNRLKEEPLWVGWAATLLVTWAAKRTWADRGPRRAWA